MARLGIQLSTIAAAGLGSASARAQPAIVDTIDISGMAMNLGLVVGLILLAAFVFKRTPLAAAGRQNGPLKIVATLPLGPKERLLLVDARGVELLIAISPAGLSVVTPGPQASEDGPGDETRVARAAERASALERVLSLKDAV